MKQTSMLLAAAVLLISLAGSSPSQSQARKRFQRCARPLKSLSLDLATGTLTRAAPLRARTASTTIDFYNNDLSGFIGVDTGNSFCEWFSAATKGFAGNQSDLMSEFTFSYCSAKLSPVSGGPGGAVKLGFYEGYTLFGGAPSTTVAVVTLTGLPGNTTSSSFFGGFQCFFLRVAFGALVPFADGPIGYSWRFLDLGTDGVLAGTWPFLACVASCSGTFLQTDGQGMTDVIDEYCPPGWLRPSFCSWGFCTTSGTFKSISMDIREATDAAATLASYNAASTPNPDVLGAGPAVVGASWSATLTRGTPSTPSGFSVVVRPNRIALADGIQGPAPLPAGAGGRLLISGALLSSLAGTHDGTSGTVSAAIPASFGLLCLHFAAQATVIGGGVKVSSAVEGTTGTF